MSILQVGSMEKKLHAGLTVFTQRLNVFFHRLKNLSAIPQGPGNTDELRSSTFWGWKKAKGPLEQS